MADWDPHIPARGLERYELEALVPLYEDALAADEDDVGALSYLGHAYTLLGRHEEGLGIDLRLVALLPEDPVVRYNLACSYALLRRAEEAIEALERAEELGYADAAHMLADEDLATLREEPRFREIHRRLLEKAG